jgi:hypothetical protein
MRFPIIVLLLFYVTTGCAQSVVQQPARTHGRTLEGYGVVRFGMPHAEALHALQQAGKNPAAVQQTQILGYQDRVEGYPFTVYQHFDLQGFATSAELWLGQAASAHNASQCQAWFAFFEQSLAKHYGLLDRSDKHATVAVQAKNTARATFQDSSFIELMSYFTPEAGCVLRITYAPVWARLCLVTNNRFCDDPGASAGNAGLMDMGD